MTDPVRMTNTAWGLLILLSVLWGGTFFFAKIALADLPPMTLVFLRVTIAAAALHVVLKGLGIRFPWHWSMFGAFLVMGLINNVIPFGLIFWGQVQIGAGLASVLNAMTPILTVVVAHFLTRDEKVTPLKVVGVLLGFAGVATMIGGQALSGLSAQLIAQLAVVLATLSYAFAGVYGRRFRQIPPLVAATGQLTASALLMLPVALFVDRPWLLAGPTIETWLAVLAIALPGTAFAYILFYRILAIAGATNLMLTTFLIPVTAILLGTLVLGEVLLPRHCLGIALITIGLIAIDGRLAKVISGRPKGRHRARGNPA